MELVDEIHGNSIKRMHLPSLDVPESRVQSIELQEQKHRGVFCQGHMSTIGARTKERHKDPSRDQREFYAPKLGETMRKKDPLDNFF